MNSKLINWRLYRVKANSSEQSEDTLRPATMTLSEAIRWAEQSIASDSSRLDAEVILAHTVGRDRTYLYTWPEKHLTEEQEAQYRETVQARIAGEPVAYILREREFWSLSLEVGRETLIPRPDTEIMIEAVVSSVNEPRRAQYAFLDLGTGTGAIAIALAKEFPCSKVTALDKFDDVVALAERNRQRHGCDNMQCLTSDWFDALPESTEFDWIVSNPPYIDLEDPHLMRGDVRFEPQSALVAAEQGLADLRHIIERAPRYLKAGGKLLLEHGWQQGEAVRKCLKENGFTEVTTYLDYASHPRVTGGCWFDDAGVADAQ